MLDLAREHSRQEGRMDIPMEIDRQGSDKAKCIISGTQGEDDNESNTFDELEANQFDWHTT